MPVAVAVALGGATGALLRYGLASWVTQSTRLGGSGTFVVNIAGAFALGLLLGLVESRVPDIPRPLATGLGVGVLGGFTTFSAFMWDVFEHAEEGRMLAAGVLVLATVACGLVAMGAGLAVGRTA